jgi:1,4-dihydroxy-2-naphthoate octaprenyltransferase
MLRLITILRLSRPLYILLSALTYFLGAGIARYIGDPQMLPAFWLGLVGIILAQICMNLLIEVYRPENEPIVPGESIASRRAIHDSALYVSIAGLAALAVIAFLLFKDGRLTPPAWLILALSLLVIVVYSVPPLRLVDKGYGEVLLALHLGFLVPSISFLLQDGSYHRLLNVTVVPLTILLLATILVLDFPSYSEDIKYERQSLLVHIGWERAVPLHHGLVVAAYVLFAFTPLLGYSLSLLWPAFLTIPFAILQIYWLRNIALGAKPIWTLLSVNAIAIFGLTAYFLTLTFWLR